MRPAAARRRGGRRVALPRHSPHPGPRSRRSGDPPRPPPRRPVLIRQGYPDRYEPAGPLKLDGIEIARWFPETARALETFPSLTDTWSAFEAAGFRRHALEQVRETYPASLADFLGEVDTFRRADTTMRNLTEDEFLRGKERLRRAVEDAEDTPDPEIRSNWLDLLVLR